MNEQHARQRVKELKGYYQHLGAYLAVNGFLLALNLVTWSGTVWFVYPLLGWGIGLAIHTFSVFWTGQDWEARKMEELTGLKNTRDELERLSERTDTLVKILADVDWEKIDPELRDTRGNLDQARSKLAQLRQSGDAKSQAEVAREIEKLEAFVTSSRFDFYDRAAAEKKPN